MITSGACDCNVIPNLSLDTIECEGTGGKKELGKCNNNVNRDMTISAELLKDGEEYEICEKTIYSPEYVINNNNVEGVNLLS